MTSSSSSALSSSTVKSHHIVERGRGSIRRRATRRHPPPQPQPSSSIPTVFKYIRSSAGIVGTITDPSGVTSINLSEAENIVGAMRAKYLDVHGYGEDVIETILDSYQSSTTVEEFVSGACGCGMTIVELEWFWQLTWSF